MVKKREEKKITKKCVSQEGLQQKQILLLIQVFCLRKKEGN